MKKLVIMKTGGLDKASRMKRYGDMENYFISCLGIPACEAAVVSVYENFDMPDMKDISAVIITGSRSMVTDREPWMDRQCQWLRSAAAGSFPILGVCFGHQLLAHAFGGIVDNHPKGVEMGTVEIELTEEGQKDRLMSGLPKHFLGNASHYQSVITLPPGARLLARNSFEPHHAFAVGDHIWGTQFHPEFDANIMKACIQDNEKDLINQGQDIETIYGSVRQESYGAMVLKRFIELAV